MSLLLILGLLNPPPAPITGSEPAAAPAIETADPASLPPEKEVAEATRFDVARAYQRLEEACDRFGAGPWDRAQVSDILDEAADMFLAGRIGATVNLLDEATNLIAGTSLPEAWRLADGRSVRPERAVTVAEGPARVRLDLVNLTPDLPGGELGLCLRTREGTLLARRVIDLSQTPCGVEFTGLPPGAYVAEWDPGQGPARIACTFVVSAESLDRARESLLARLDAIPGAPEPTRDIARGRAALITDHPPGRSFAELRFDPLTRLAEVRAEVGAIAEGRDPYAARAGDLWRTVATRAGPVPVRLYVPPRLGVDQPRSGPGPPLVIALHGAGGDENLWMDGYAAGAIRRLADERGFIVASPLTYPFLGDPGIFDDLVRELRLHYPVDPLRIHIIGHSLGGIGVSLLAQRRAGVIASACAIAGAAGLDADRPCAPLLVIAAERDRIMPASRIRRACRGAIAAGLPVELRESAGLGHALVVAVELRGAVDWLLAHPRDADAPGAP